MCFHERSITLKKVCCVITLIFVLQSVFAEEEPKKFFIVPIVNYEYLTFDEQTIHSPALGITYINGNTIPALNENQNSLMITGFFKEYFIKETRDEYVGLYHYVLVSIEKKMNRHLFLGNTSSMASEPYYGGFHTFTGILGYGNEFIRYKNISLTAGGVLLVTDFDIELSNGMMWPIMPYPLLRFNVISAWVNLSFDFMTNAKLDFTILPEKRIRFSGSFIVNPFIVSEIRDLLVDVALWYRFFSRESKMGDFAGIGIGFKNSGLGPGIANQNFNFKLSEKNKNYAVDYHSVYGILDFSFLKFSGGYSFSGREIYDKDVINKIGDGFFTNATLMWRF